MTTELKKDFTLGYVSSEDGGDTDRTLNLKKGDSFNFHKVSETEIHFGAYRENVTTVGKEFWDAVEEI